mgnify:FL=1
MTRSSRTQATRDSSYVPTFLDGYDKWLIGCILVLISFGLVMVLSTSGSLAESRGLSPFYYFWRQVVAISIGGFVSLLLLKIDTRNISKLGFAAILFAMFCLVAVLIPGLSHEVNGSKRWLYVGTVSFQPSELTKLASIIYLSAYLVRHNLQVRSEFIGFIKPMLVLTLIAVLLLLEPDYGACVVLFGTSIGMLFLAGVPIMKFCVGGALVTSVLSFVAIREQYRMERILSFLNPWEDERGASWQLTNALIAMGRGDWFGVGLGNSVQKLGYLPEPHTDFVFAVIGEEFGASGAVVIILIFMFVVWRIFRIGAAAERNGNIFGAYLTYGVGFVLGIQALVNIAVNVGYLPTKGLPLPLLSYASNNLVFTIIALALVLRVGREIDYADISRLIGRDL